MVVDVPVGRGVQVAVQVAVQVGVGVRVGVAVGVRLGVGVEVRVGSKVAVGLGVLVGLGVRVGWGAPADWERGVLVGFSGVGVSGLKTAGSVVDEAPSVMMTNAKVTSRRSWAQASLAAVYVVVNTNQRPLVQPFASQSLSLESQ